MLAIQKSQHHQGNYTPNVLPCRINHNGPINVSKRYWTPTSTSDNKRISYFRGRKLYGRAVRVPEGYRGVIVASTEHVLSKSGEKENGEEEEEVRIMEERGEFEEVVVWGHEILPEEGVDAHLLGMGEWIGLADKVHGYEVDGKGGDGSKKA